MCVGCVSGYGLGEIGGRVWYGCASKVGYATISPRPIHNIYVYFIPTYNLPDSYSYIPSS